MAVPPQLIMAAMQMIKNRKSTKDRIKEALAPATDALKNDIMPFVSMGADAGMMYNLRAEDPSMRTGITTGAVGAAARGFQNNGIKGLLTGGLMGGLTGAIATGNAKEKKAEQDNMTYLNQMYGSVVGEDYNLQSLLYAEDGGEIVSPEGEVFVPVQTEAKKIGKKLVKEKLIFSDGKISDVNATKPHSEQKKDDVTDIVVEGTYVMPVSTKLSKKDLDSLVSYSTSSYSENGKNFAVEKVTLRDILGKNFEGSFAEATDIITKKYPVMDTDDDLDPIARITNNENIANRSKIIAHLMRLNEAKINKEPIQEVKLTPSMKAKRGGYVQKYVLGSTVTSDPKPKRKMNINQFPFLEKVGITPAESKARIFHEDSLNSEGYKKRIRKKAPSGYTEKEKDEYANEVINERKANLRSTKNKGLKTYLDNVSAEYDSYEEAIGFRKDYINNTPVNTHELSHSTTKGFNNFLVADAKLIHKRIETKNKNKDIDDDYYNYLISPTEVKARLDVLKQYAAEKGIVKIGEDITPAKMDDLINSIYNDESIEAQDVYDHYDDLLKILKEDRKNSKADTLGKLWNEIADSNSKIKPDMVAKKGGYVKKYVLGSIVKRSGPGDPPKGKKYKSKTGTIIVGDDGKYYYGKKDGSFIEASEQTVKLFENQLKQSKSTMGSENTWLLVEDNSVKENRPLINIKPLPTSKFKSISSMYPRETIDALGTPIYTDMGIPSADTEEEVTVDTKPNNTKPQVRYYAPEKTNQNLTPDERYLNNPYGEDIKRPINSTDTVKKLPTLMPKVIEPESGLDFGRLKLSSEIKDKLKNTIPTAPSQQTGEKWKDELLTKRWQERLKKEGLYQDGEVDGAWGPKTQAAYESYQKMKKSPKKMARGGYIKKMVTGGPIVPIIPEPWRDIWAIDETGIEPYYELGGIPAQNFNPNITSIDPNTLLPGSVPDGNTSPNASNANPTTGVTPSSNQTPTDKDKESIETYRSKIDERKADALRDAEEAKKGYKALSRRVGMRDLLQLGTGLVGIGLQDRTQKRAFKRPLYIDQKYRGLSPQQINQEAEAATGAGVEAIKQMMNGGGDRVTSRLAPVLIDRLISQQGQTRKAYVDQNMQLERNKYGERGAIQQFNLDEESKAQNIERDFNNKAIADTSSLLNKYTSSRSQGDITDFATNRGIEQDLTTKMYALDNQSMEVDMIEKDYDMQIAEVKQKIADIEAELTKPNVNIDEQQKASLKRYQEQYKKIAEDLEKRKIRSNINGK